MPDRPRLPPFAALRAFHAAASYDRFRDAAEALGITESAVSHQVRRLEEFLHVALFDRSGGGARLTPAGRRYLEEIDPAIRRIAAATEAMLGGHGRKVVRLTLPASLAVTWLIPQLGAFERTHRDIELQLVTTTRLLDLKRDQIDIAIRHGKGEWPGLDCSFLLDEMAFPVCAPGYLTLKDGEDPHASLRRARLIVNTRSPEEWEEWSRARGLPPLVPGDTMAIEGQEEALRLAEQGLGVAIGRTLFIDDRLASGKLFAPFGTSDPSGAAYYLCRPAGIAATAAVRRVARWLKQLAAGT